MPPTTYCKDCKHFHEGRCYAHPPRGFERAGEPEQHTRVDPDDVACNEFVPAPATP